MSHFKIPSAYTILCILIVIVTLLTWVIPAGRYQTEINTELNKVVLISGTYTQVDNNPQNLFSILMTPIIGFYDPNSGKIRAADISLFILIIGGYLGIVKKTGAIDIGIKCILRKLKEREEWIIPILMMIFAIAGSVCGMAEESLPFYSLLAPIMLSARFDPVVSASIILLGTGIGTIGSTINPFATVIASNIAGISFTHGIILRVVLLIISWFLCVIWVMYYAKRIRKNPSLSIIADKQKENCTYFFTNDNEESIELSIFQKIVLMIFVLSFIIMIYGMIVFNWWMAQISTVFLIGGIIIGLIARMNEKEIISTFINGAQDLLEVALIVGIARGVIVVMDEALITHTILHSIENIVTGLSGIVFVNGIYWLETLLSFIIPSSSSLAIMTMPIIIPLADFANVSKDLVVTTYQAASGVINLITPTSAVLIGGLTISNIPYFRYLKWITPLLILLMIMITILLSITVLLQ